MSTVNIRLYDFLKQEFKLSDAKAKEFVEIISEASQEEIKINSNEYRSILKEDLLKLEMNLRSEIKDVRVEIKDTKIDTIKCMVGFFIGLALMIIGLYFKN